MLDCKISRAPSHLNPDEHPKQPAVKNALHQIENPVKRELLPRRTQPAGPTTIAVPHTVFAPFFVRLMMPCMYRPSVGPSAASTACR